MSDDLALDELVAPMAFSPQLEAAIAEVSPSTDPIDAPDFDPIAHINRLFPNEESLSQVDSYVGGLHERMRGLDEEVLLTVRQQTSAGSSARKDLENGRQAVAELFVKVRDIKSKAEASEAMVHEICRDIKSLDYAKRHLTLTIRALKRLQMLVTAVEQLVVMTQERMYAEAANLLQAVNSLLVHFEDYGHVKKVAELREQIDEVKTNLRKQVFDDFNQLSAEGSEGVQPSNVETLKGACAVVDALGSDVRKEMIAWFSGWQFAPYKHAFQPYAEYGTLEKAELRCAAPAQPNVAVAVTRPLRYTAWRAEQATLACAAAACARRRFLACLRAGTPGTRRCSSSTTPRCARCSRRAGRWR